MLPSRHIVVSLSLGAIIWYYTRSSLAVILCFASGVLIDIDHLFDYLVHYGFKTLKLKEIYRTCGNLAKREGGGPRRLHLFFHAVEIAVLLWVVLLWTKNIYLLAIALGYSGHLILDMSANTIKPRSYLITYRIMHNFRTIQFLRNI